MAFMFSKFKRADKEQTVRYGEIKRSIFAYITPWMLVTAGIVLFVIAISLDTLIVYFKTNVALNGLIIFTGGYALLGTFNNNYKLYQSAKILNWIDDIMEQDELPSEGQMHKLRYTLDNKASLLNTRQMFGVLDKVEEFGAPQFSDLEARLIKSKLGYRVRINRSDVGFLAGILVMLGLLGTFLGLLKTIDAVGAAMGSMSSIGGESGEVSVEDMSGFITKLAEPLQGMGLAFSSSLFGLSSSLLTGFFNHLGGGAQNQFIEDVSRWIDDRIPRFEPKAAGVDKDEMFPSGDDLKTWLAGFVYLSVKTNRKMSRLVQALSNQSETALRSVSYLEDIATSQKDVGRLIARMDANITNASDNVRQMHDRVALSHDTLVALQSNVKNMSENISGINEYLGSSSKTLSILPSKINEMGSIIQQMGASQQQMSDEMSHLSKVIAESSRHDEISHMTMQLTTMLEELNSKNEAAFFKVFSQSPAQKNDGHQGGGIPSPAPAAPPSSIPNPAGIGPLPGEGLGPDLSPTTPPPPVGMPGAPLAGTNPNLPPEEPEEDLTDIDKKPEN